MENKKQLTLQECQSISLDILKDVALFCEKNNIKYYLACGTLLGAVRHQGFIPWDDDVDIMMPRPDYNRFLKEYKSDNYLLCKPEEGRHYYAKVYDKKTVKYEKGIDYKKYKPLGIDIDIFPLDGIVDDKEVIDKLYKKANTLETFLRLSNQPIFLRKNPLKCINRILPRLFGSKRLVRLVEKNAQTYKYEDSEYVIRIRVSPNGFTGALRKDVYEPYKLLKFEDQEFRVPNDYDKWLTVFFGDYMKLPPEEKRVSGHYTECYYKDE